MPDGRVVVTIAKVWPDGKAGQHFYTVEYDREELDLDHDDLRLSQERMLGTSDFDRDSDGGGSLDGFEANVEHTSPADRTDDSTEATRARPFAYSVSSLIRRRLPGDSIVPKGMRRFSIRGPLCLGRSCYGPDGRVALELPTERAAELAQVSMDGTFVAYPVAGQGLFRTFFEGGRTELYLRESIFHTQLGLDPSSLVLPIDEHRTLLVDEQGSSKVVLFSGGEPRVLFDLEKARCDSGLGPCDSRPRGRVPNRHYRLGLPLGASEPSSGYEDLPLFDLAPRAGFELLGYDPSLEALELSVLGTWETWSVRVPLDGEPVILKSAQTLMGTMRDSYLMFPPAVGVVPELDLPFMPNGQGGRVGWAPYVVGAWGDSLFFSIDPDSRLIQYETGLFELVRYEQGLSSGDVVILREEVEAQPGALSVRRGAMLFKSGARGGLVPLWRSVDQSIGRVWGIDISADHRLCVAERDRDRLVELLPTGSSKGVPIRVSTLIEAKVRDCDYDSQGRLIILVADPPSIHRCELAGTECIELESLSKPGHQLVERPDGTYEVLFDGDEASGATHLADGRRATVFASGDRAEIRVEGVPVATLPRRTWVSAGATSPGAKAKAHFVARPDGLLVVVGHDIVLEYPPSDTPSALAGTLAPQFWYPSAIDPVGHTQHELAHQIAIEGGLAIVPGGLAVDPWTSQPLTGSAWRDDLAPPGAPIPPNAGQPAVAQASCTCRDSQSRRAPSTLIGLATLATVCWVLRRRRVGAQRSRGDE